MLKDVVNATGFDHVNAEFTFSDILQRSDDPIKVSCGAATTTILYHIHLSFSSGFSNRTDIKAALRFGKAKGRGQKA